MSKRQSSAGDLMITTLVEQKVHQRMWMLEMWVVERNVETEVRVGHEMESHLQLRLEADPHSKEADPLDHGAGPLELEAVPLDPGAGPLDLEVLDLGIDWDFSLSKGTPKCWNTEVRISLASLMVAGDLEDSDEDDDDFVESPEEEPRFSGLETLPLPKEEGLPLLATG
ncbi:hypothetical protein Taro_055811 [Colocasia esculenta]|uniref:Uncharacterized protein n=1 Tax=Colocasia esculenta TaxID=4460 RepID=A0A843XSA0_COLES|nr:hypothetical protein [Colocasia esculenta]